MVVDGSGNIFIVGTSRASWGTNIKRAYSAMYDAFVAKLNSSGVYQWNAFLGGAGEDSGYGIALDSGGNIIVTGNSTVGWGTPVRGYEGNSDVFAAKLGTDGSLTWHTFLGRDADNDYGYAVAVDSEDKLYVVGESQGDWTNGGTPLASYINGPAGGTDGFAAKLDALGNLDWYTFMGSTANDAAWGAAMSSGGSLFVSGEAGGSWPTPVDPYQSPGSDAFVAKLFNTGTRDWHTFMGVANDDDGGREIVVDGSENVYLTGTAHGSWGTPIRGFSALSDAFVAKLSNTGARQWHTYLGGSSSDYGYGIFRDSAGYIYADGYSWDSWGSPVNPFTNPGSFSDAFLARLNSSGGLDWNTFMGSANDDWAHSVAKDSSGNVVVAGNSKEDWGSPVNAHTAGSSWDAMVASLADTVTNYSSQIYFLPGGSTVSQYRSIAMPFKAADPSAAAVLGPSISGIYNNTQTRFGRWSTSGTHYQEYPDFSLSNAGDAFWALSRFTRAISFSGTPPTLSPDPVNGTPSLVIPVCQGWNQVGNGLLHAIDISQAVAASGGTSELLTAGTLTQGIFWVYNGGYGGATKLDAMMGGWIKWTAAGCGNLYLPDTPTTYPDELMSDALVEISADVERPPAPPGDYASSGGGRSGGGGGGGCFISIVE